MMLHLHRHLRRRVVVRHGAFDVTIETSLNEAPGRIPIQI